MKQVARDVLADRTSRARPPTGILSLGHRDPGRQSDWTAEVAEAIGVARDLSGP
jgi:hypothetical protein